MRRYLEQKKNCGDVSPSTIETISASTLDDLVVPSPFSDFHISGKCKLEGSVVVTGNINVEPVAVLQTSGITINGNLQVVR